MIYNTNIYYDVMTNMSVVAIEGNKMCYEPLVHSLDIHISQFHRKTT